METSALRITSAVNASTPVDGGACAVMTQISWLQNGVRPSWIDQGALLADDKRFVLDEKIGNHLSERFRSIEADGVACVVDEHEMGAREELAVALAHRVRDQRVAHAEQDQSRHLERAHRRFELSIRIETRQTLQQLLLLRDDAGRKWLVTGDPLRVRVQQRGALLGWNGRSLVVRRKKRGGRLENQGRNVLARLQGQPQSGPPTKGRTHEIVGVESDCLDGSAD